MVHRGCSYLFVAAVGLLSAASARSSCVGAEAGLSQVQRSLAQGRIQSAFDRLSGLTASHPECPPVVAMQAQFLARQGMAREAEEWFLRAVELGPDQPEAHFHLGVFYDSRQQHAKAAERFRKVLSLQPSDPQAYDYLALSLEAQGQFDKAEAAYRMGLARNSGPRFDPMLHYNYGRYLMKQSRLAEARSHLDEAVRQAPSVRAVHYERARVAERLGDLQGARVHAERALQLEDRGGVILDMQVFYLLSRLYRVLGEDELAARYTALSQKAEIPLDARRRSGR